MGLKDRSPYLQFGGKIDPLSEIRNAGIVTTGNVWWVKHDGDADYKEFKDAVGKENVFTDIQSAIDKCKNDENDYVLVCPKAAGSAYDLTTGLNLNKDKVHLIGVGAGPRDTDYGVVIRGFGTSSTATTIDTYGLLYITGDGVEVAGIKFAATAGTGAGGTIGGAGSAANDSGGIISVYGQNPYIHDCYIRMDGGAWDVGTPDAAIIVGSAMHGGLIDNVRILTGTETADGTIHGVNLLFNNERWEIKNTLIESFCTNAEESAVKLSPGTALSQGAALFMENCTFINYNSGTAADEMVGGTAMKNSFGFMKNCASLYTTAAHSSDALVFISPAYAGGTINNLLQDPGLAILGTSLVITKT